MKAAIAPTNIKDTFDAPPLETMRVISAAKCHSGP
jgi:hypothetical protein